METLLRQVLASGISQSGQQLKRWIAVLDELAETRVLSSADSIDMPAVLRVVTDASTQLALDVAQAYASQFYKLIEYAIAIGLPGAQPELQNVAHYKALMTNPRGVYAQMLADYQAKLLKHAEAADDN